MRIKATEEEDIPVALHKKVLLLIFPKAPLEPLRQPPGRAVNPLELSAPVFGEFQSEEVDFNLPPATEEPPNCVSKSINCARVGTCQPVGQMFFVGLPIGVTIPPAAYQLYKNP